MLMGKSIDIFIKICGKETSKMIVLQKTPKYVDELYQSHWTFVSQEEGEQRVMHNFLL